MLGHRYRNHDRYRDGYRDRDRQKKEKGTGKAADGERRRCFEIAQGSAWECAAIEDVRVVGKALDEAESENRKTELDRMAAMLSRLGGRGYPVREKASAYGGNPVDPDPDRDSDLDEDKCQSSAAAYGLRPLQSRDAELNKKEVL